MRPVELGLPTDDLSGVSTLYLPDAEVFVVNAWVYEDNARWGRVYARRRNEGRYWAVQPPPPQRSDACALAISPSEVAILRQVGTRTPNGWGFRSVEILRVDFMRNASRVLILPSAEESWVVSIEGADVQGRYVYATVGRPGATSHRHCYSVERIDWESGEMVPMMDLPAIWA